MSLTREAIGQDDNRPQRSVLRMLMNAAICGFFLVGVVVAAGSFGLFGCWCNEGFVRRDRPAEKVDIPVKGGEMPPLPSPPK